MAPRRRPRKVGLTRMDAALDAMRPLGFRDAVVRKSVRILLKVYGGDAGWGFVEEAAYKLLIDTILEEQEKAQQDKLQEQYNKVEFEQQGRVQESYEQVGCVPEAGDEEERVQEICEHEVFDKGTHEEEKCGEEKFEVENCLSPKDDAWPGELEELVNFLPSGSSPSLDCLSTKKRKPCYGWISSDADDDDFIFLMPAELINTHPRDSGQPVQLIDHHC